MDRLASSGLALALLTPWAPLACSDDTGGSGSDDPSTTAASSSGSTPASTTTEATTADETMDVTDGGAEPLPPPGPADFVVTIENVSSTGLLVSPLSPALWVTHQPGSDPLFSMGAIDHGQGLEALAEDGDPQGLAAALQTHPDVDHVGVVEVPVGAAGPGPLLPGDAYELPVTAQPGTRLSVALMVVGSNDQFIAPDPIGISLFDSGGGPLPARDVTAQMQLWDAGTEITQAPGQGPTQALHGGSPDAGPDELPGVHRFESSTRAIPLGPDLVQVTVTEDRRRPGTLRLQLTNVTLFRQTLVTEFSSIVWAIHDDTVTLFTEGAGAPAPLEALAEDGDPGPYDAMLAGQPGVVEHAVIPGPIDPGQSTFWSITPSNPGDRLSLAMMIDQSNDAFLAAGPAGIPLFDARGELRSPEALTDDIAARLTAWDAGTEANEVPGAGPNQRPRQPAPDTGPPETVDPTVHRYADPTNDLAGPSAGGVLQVEVNETGGAYTITLTNVSDTTAFPLRLGSVVWSVHDDTFGTFIEGEFGGAGIELMAEDDSIAIHFGDVATHPGTLFAGIANVPVGEMSPSWLDPGQSYAFTAVPDATHRFVGFTGVLIPSNDTFVAPGPTGVALLDEGGAPRPAATVQAELSAALTAWDAGSEGNQAGAAGAHMGPLGLANGPLDGFGIVSRANLQPVWSPPAIPTLVRITVAPAED